MARDSAVGRERILVVPSSLALDNSSNNQHIGGAQNDLNQQILEVSQSSHFIHTFFLSFAYRFSILLVIFMFYKYCQFNVTLCMLFSTLKTMIDDIFQKFEI